MATEPLAGDPAATLKKVVASLLNSKDFSDLTLTCKDKVFKAHKAVICPQSRFFYNACKKNTFKESETGNIDLSHDDVAAVEAMYRYFYGCDYDDLAKKNSNAMLLHVRVYCLAHKYEIKTLETLAADQFQKTARADFNSTSLPTFSRVVREIYKNTQESDKRLRNLAVMTAIDNHDALLKEADGDGFSNKMATDNQGATLKKGVASLLESNDFSDMTITVKDNKVFKVHKNIISSQSKFFYNACTKDFKEKKEANIDLSEQDPDAVEALLEYLYKSDYTRLTKDNVTALVLHVHIYQLADMYDIAELKTVAAGLFEEAAKKDWELPAFPLAVQEIYINPEDDAKTLRKLVVNQANENLEALLKDDDGEFAQVMTTFGEFGKDLCRASFQGPTSNRNLVHFRCKTYCGLGWRIDQRKASKLFVMTPVCPMDKIVMTKMDGMEGQGYFDYKCQSCNFVVGCANTISNHNTWHCPGCGQRTNFKKT
ncbi:Leptomycin B resistance protein pmd1 [Venturia nashicola]|nr:Leptomycin B resistance protein pmd1 [Venturia nashicola]